MFTNAPDFGDPDIQHTRWYGAIDLCLAGPGRVVATAGTKESLQTTDRVRPVKVNDRSGRPLCCLYFDHNSRAGRLYRETIQHSDPARHRPCAPVTCYASDTGDDYFRKLMREHEVRKNRRTIWKKVSQNAVHDFGDSEKIGLVQYSSVRVSTEDSNYLLRNETQKTTRSDQ